VQPVYLMPFAQRPSPSVDAPAARFASAPGSTLDGLVRIASSVALNGVCRYLRAASSSVFSLLAWLVGRNAAALVPGRVVCAPVGFGDLMRALLGLVLLVSSINANAALYEFSLTGRAEVSIDQASATIRDISLRGIGDTSAIQTSDTGPLGGRGEPSFLNQTSIVLSPFTLSIPGSGDIALLPAALQEADPHGPLFAGRSYSLSILGLEFAPPVRSFSLRDIQPYESPVGFSRSATLLSPLGSNSTARIDFLAGSALFAAQPSVPAVPEPGTIALMVFGALALAGLRRARAW
jgi:hypothetical protein